MEERSTIAAVATAPGRGGVAIVRVSGSEAFAVAEAVAGRPPEPGRAALRRFRRNGALIDQGVLLAFRAPGSYTGEDVVEFHCHGGSVTPARVLEACFAAGARLARRGEFTERAFLNGRMDLSEAEGVIELVDAKTERAADDALARLSGAGTRVYESVYERALELSAALEHALDIDETDLPPSFWADANASLAALAAEIDAALSRAREGRILRSGALVVLSGPPNSGKSSLMNALLGERRAIVSATPGTTRDSIEECLDVDGWPVRLVDTAGLRSAKDEIEAEGVRRAEELVARADIVVRLDAADQRGAPDEAADAADPRVLRVSSKCDISRGEGLNVSAVTGEGLDALKAEIARRLAAFAGGPGDCSATPSERERSLLAEARANLRPSDDPVLLANSVRAAADALGRLAGAVYADDLLDAVFSRFCVGK